MTSEVPTPDLTELERLLEKATPGEWDIWAEPCRSRYEAISELTDQVHATDPFVGELILLNAGGKCPASTGCGPTSRDNGALIVALKNAAPHLITAARECNELFRLTRAAIRERDEAQSALEDLQGEVGRFKEALRRCKAQFEFYVEQHMAKSPPDGAKAEANEHFAAICRMALNPSPEAKS